MITLNEVITSNEKITSNEIITPDEIITLYEMIISQHYISMMCNPASRHFHFSHLGLTPT